MATLGIKGHPTRGKEVIQLLEMLGGKSNSNMNGYNDDLYYFIAKDGFIYGSDIEYEELNCKYTIFTLEVFLEKFPYKVGDNVITQFNNVYKINEIMWNNKEIVYALTDGNSITCWYNTAELQPYKEENYCQVTGNDTSSNGVNTSASLIIEETMEEKGTLVQIDLTREMNVNDEVEVILGDYEFVLKDGKTYFIKKKPRYPKDYEECCEVLGYSGNYNMILTTDIDCKLFNALYRLKVCRDAYWKIAGEQMGLDKPWEPDWESETEQKYTIVTDANEICSGLTIQCNAILAFPTEEMRDAFFENFKELIEQCKELL